MSGAKCIIATFELDELAAPSHALETCIREACRNPMVAEAYSRLPDIALIETILPAPQYNEMQQKLLKKMLLGIT